MTKNRTPTPVYLDPGMHPGLEVKGLKMKRRRKKQTLPSSISGRHLEEKVSLIRDHTHIEEKVRLTRDQTQIEEKVITLRLKRRSYQCGVIH